MTATQVVAEMKKMGFAWDARKVGIKFEDGKWNVNAVLLNDDGTRKPVWGFLGFATADEAVEAKVAMEQ